MFAYLSPNDSLTAVLGGAISTTNPTYHVIFKSETGGYNDAVGSLNGTTAVTVASAPSAGQKQVERIEIFNDDTAAVTITLSKVTSGTGTTLRTVTLQADDTLYVDASGAKVLDANGMSRIIRTGYTTQVGTRAKVGATAGWTVAAANDLPYVGTVAASQTASTLVIPIDGLHIGDTITAFKIIAQIESAGGAVTLDAALRAVTNVAAEPTDASIGAITQVSVTADTAVAASKTGLTEVVTSGKSYYLLLTATTAASTDIILQHCELVVTTA